MSYGQYSSQPRPAKPQFSSHQESKKRLKHIFDNPAHVWAHPRQKDGSGFEQTDARVAGGNWYYIGIRAEAEIGIPSLGAQVKGTKKMESGLLLTTQHITSGGLWGVESDSEKSYLESVEKEELTDLRAQLKALGFSSRAISQAFKPENIREKND